VNQTRAAGWYPDPWGTAAERYFDGGAWSRQTRPVGTVGDDPPPAIAQPAVPTSPVVEPGVGVPGGRGVATTDPAPVAGQPGEAPSADAQADMPPPGWHPDPWGLAALRWWDGANWSGHVSGPPTSAGPDIVGEQTLARYVKPALLLGGLAQAAAMFGTAEQAQWFADHWDELNRTTGPVPRMPATTTIVLGQFGGLVGIVVGVLFLLWFYRAASNGWASGLPARRGPGLATFSFIIPILNLWWPYQSTKDMIPIGDPGRSLVLRWWVLWLGGGASIPLMFLAAAVSGETATRVVAAMGAALMIAAAVAARAVVEHVTETHARMTAGQAA
jgi:hypothetical protein